MKKIFFLILAFTSCNDTVKNHKSDSQPNNHYELENFIISFKNEYPNWGQNDIINHKINAVFKDSISNFLRERDTVFWNLPVEFKDIIQYAKSKYVAKFSAEIQMEETKVSVTIGGVITDNFMNLLKTDNMYRIKGKFTRLVPNAFVGMLPISDTLIEFTPEIVLQKIELYSQQQ